MSITNFSNYVQIAFNGLSIIGMLFLVYRNWRAPQEKSEKESIRLADEFSRLRADFINLRDNHVHTLDVKLDETNKSITNLAIEYARLNTIIEERIPKKTQS